MLLNESVEWLNKDSDCAPKLRQLTCYLIALLGNDFPGSICAWLISWLTSEHNGLIIYYKIERALVINVNKCTVYVITTIQYISPLKGSSDAKFTLQVVWTLMRFGHVCTHPSYKYKNPPSVFLIPILKSPFSNQAVLRFLSEWRSSVQAPATIVDWQGCFTLDPPWVSWELSTIVSTPVQRKTRMPPIKQLRCFVVGCYNEYSSCHLLPTSEPLKTQRINVTFVLKECADPRSA